MALPTELNTIFKNKQKSYKMVLILALLDEMDEVEQRLVSYSKVKQRFLAYYILQEQEQQSFDAPPEKLAKQWKDITPSQLNSILDTPVQALSHVLEVDVANDTIGIKQPLWDEFLPQTVLELRQYALLELDLYKKERQRTIPLSQYLSRILNEYLEAKRQPFTNHPLGLFTRQTIPEQLRSLPFLDQGYKVQGSVGMGNWADVPWIAIMDKRITETTQRGEYLVYLFDEMMESVYLSFAQGVTQPLQEKGKKAGYEYLRNKVKEIRESLPLEGFQKDEEIYLTKKGIGESYQVSTIAYKKYDRNQMPTDEVLIEDLRALLENYRQYVNLKQSPTATKPVFRYTMSHIYYGQGILKFLGDNSNRSVPLDELIQNHATILKSGADVQHPKERIMHVGRALKDLGLLEIDDNHFKLNETIGTEYVKSFSEDFWSLSDEQVKTFHRLIEEGNEHSSELIQVIKHAVQLAANLGRFTLEAFQQGFIEAMGDTGWGEVTQNNRAKFMLNWLQDIKYIVKDQDQFVFVKEPSNVSPLTVKEQIEHIHAFIKERGFQYPEGLIENFYLSLKTKPFVILAGISGTGKTKLVKLFADAIGAGNGTQFTLIPVRPDWSDPTDLLGYKDLNGDFRKGRLTEVLLEASKPENRRKPYFICLDEMNLARVEHYFSDMLSILETQRFEGEQIVTDSLLSKDLLGMENDLIIPDNVFILGTVNMDETTHPFSKKVLDRANTIEFNYISLEDYPTVTGVRALAPAPAPAPNEFLRSEYIHLKDAYAEYEGLIKSTTQKLVDINLILEEIYSHIGFRARDSICFYMIYNQRFGLLAEAQAFDIQLLQKILPRIQGSSQSVKRVLIDLLLFCTSQKLNTDHLMNDPTELYDPWKKTGTAPEALYPQSARKLAYMLRRLEEDGFTSFWLS